MPDPRPRFTVIDGGTGERTQATLYNTGILGDDGNPVFRPGNGGGNDGGDGGMTSIFKLDIPRDVQLAKWGVAGLAALMAAMLWFLLAKIDGRFDRADEKIGTITEQVANVRVEIAGQRGDIKAVLEKLDDKSQGSPRTGKVGQVP